MLRLGRGEAEVDVTVAEREGERRELGRLETQTPFAIVRGWRAVEPPGRVDEHRVLRIRGLDNPDGTRCPLERRRRHRPKFLLLLLLKDGPR